MQMYVNGVRVYFSLLIQSNCCQKIANILVIAIVRYSLEFLECKLNADILAKSIWFRMTIYPFQIHIVHCVLWLLQTLEYILSMCRAQWKWIWFMFELIISKCHFQRFSHEKFESIIRCEATKEKQNYYYYYFYQKINMRNDTSSWLNILLSFLNVQCLFC